MNEYHKIQTVFLRNPETKYKTLLEGVYSLPEFEYLAENQWVFTEKVDGMNIRVIYDGKGGIEYGGKTDRAQIPSTLINEMRNIFIAEDFKEFNEGITLYGEGYGPKIQKGGGKYRDSQSFVLFDIKIGDYWLLRKDVEDIASKLDIDVVPIIGEGTLSDMVEIVKGGFNSQWGDFKAEGIVARPETELKTRNGSRIITKIKCKDFA